MNVPANNFYSRRKFLQTGGLALASAAVLAACGKNDKLAAGIPRLGEAPTTTGLPDGGATDIVLLRTATSLEYCAIDAYGAVADLNILPATSAAALKRFRDDHSAHAKALSELVKKVGGEPFECANEKINSLYISPALDLILGNKDKGIDPSDTQVDDLVVLAHGVENLAAATYQFYVSMLSVPGLRAAAMGIGQEEARHAAVLAQAILPNGKGIAPSVDEATGKANPAAVPAAFGSLSAVQVSLGKVNESGNKPSISMDTPSLNSMAYEYAKC